MRKGSRDGGEINAKLHQKSMQKLVAEKMRKILKNQVFPMCKNRFLIGRYSKFEVLQGECANLKIHQKTIKNEVKFHPQIYEKTRQISCSKK